MSYEQAETVFESLRLERLNVQKKTFTKWANVHLQKYNLHIDDLFKDLGDGLKLMKLLESLTGEKLGKPARGSARINKIENISRCLAFIQSKKMRLENISSEDIVDGKPHLILGLLWTIILRCEIWKHQQTANEGESDYPIVPPPPEGQTYYPVHKIAKESLLLWCQSKTDGYSNVRVRDFHRSWRDGLAFNALIHSYVPALVDFKSLKQYEHVKNLENAFDIAQKHIGVPRLLDPEDVDTDNPDEKSIIIYVSTFSKGLGSIKKGMTGGKRIANVLQKMMEINKMKEDYGKQASDILEWIHSKVYEFKYMPELDSLESIQEEIIRFKEYRTKEKPVKNDLKNEIEALLFAIQMKRFGQKAWVPPEETSPAEIEKAWHELEIAEHQHEIDVRNQLKEQERLENLAYKFESKRTVRQNFLNDMQKILTDPNYGPNIKQVDATFKKHEAIRTGIIAREIMIKDFLKIADTLIEGNYRNKENIIQEKKEIEEQWNYVMSLLEAFDEKFANLRRIMSILDEMESVSEEMAQMQLEMESESEPLDIESSLQNHAVKEVQIASWEEAIRRLEYKIFSQNKTKDASVLQIQLNKLRQTYQILGQISQSKRDNLESFVKQKEKLGLINEMLSWLQEKHHYCSADVNCRDLASALTLQKKHKALGSEIQLQKELSKDLQEPKLDFMFKELEELYQDKYNRIEIATNVYQYSADANECDIWISEKLHLLSSLDYGTDELSCEALSRRHIHMQTKILSYSSEIELLKQEAKRICQTDYFQTYEMPSKPCLITSEKTLQDALSSSSEPGSMKRYIEDRQDQIEKSFLELQRKCDDRQQRLRHTSMFFKLKDGCEEMEKWMRQQEQVINANELVEEEEKVGKSFEAFLTDLAAHGLVIEELRNLADILEEEQAEQANTAKILYDDVYRRWKHLHDLTSFKEKNWKGFTSLMLAHRTCDETSSFLEEKCNINYKELPGDIKNLDALRRKQEALQRELEPAEERVKQALVLAENVSNSYPDQKEQIKRKIEDLTDKWEKFQISIEQKKQNLEDSAGLRIFQTSANELIEWSNVMVKKVSVREKIGDIGIADNLIKEHSDLKDEIVAQDERFKEVENLGRIVKEKHQEVEPLLIKLEEAKRFVIEHWEEKDFWLQQKRNLQLFNKEADQLQSLCNTQTKLLEINDRGSTLSDVENLLRNLNVLLETMNAQENRFIVFKNIADELIAAEHPEFDIIKTRSAHVLENRQKVLELAKKRKHLLLDTLEFQEFKADAQEMIAWIQEKNKLVSEFSNKDINTNLPNKMKRQQTFEAEIASNRKRIQDTLSTGDNLMKNNENITQSEVAAILDDLGKEWNTLIDMMELNQSILQKAVALRDFNSSVEYVLKKLAEIIHGASSTDVGKNLRSVKTLIKKLETLENDRMLMSTKVEQLTQDGEQLIEAECSEKVVKNLINNLNEKLQESEKLLLERRKKLETCLKFHQFKSDVDRELLWIAEQMVLASNSPNCRNLLDAQKFQKKIENMDVANQSHKTVIENLQETVLLLVTEDECPVDVTQPCIQMKENWTQLLKEFSLQKEKAAMTLKAQSFYCEASEIDTWISEKLDILTNTDYGKDEDAVIKLLTKHKALELEIDSYKGLVDELGSQAEVLTESNHPDSKIIKNRMEVINQEMKNLQKLCSVKRQKLMESKSLYECQNETEELKQLISEQMAEATSEDYGEDYEHVLILHQNFEFFKTRIENASKRVLQYEEFAKRLISSNCYFSEDVKTNLDDLSARWTELFENIEARSFKMEAAAEIHRYHRDVTDILSRIHGYYRIIPQDFGNNLNQVQELIKKHDKMENELLGVEAQVHILLKDSQRLQETYPGGNEEHIQMQLSLVVENWNLLQQKMSGRKDQLLAAERVHKFIVQVKNEEDWSKSICLDLYSAISSRDIQQLENEHKVLCEELESRLQKYEEFTEEGKSLQTFDILSPQLEEKLKSLPNISKRVREAYNKRSEYVQQKKDTMLFFSEAKQLQATCTQKEVQLCGRQTRETVEDISEALKKHLDYQKSMAVQEEKFTNWRKQGQTLLRQGLEEAPKIEQKLEDLTERRQRLLDFSSERCQTLSEALQQATFKRDTIEAEGWIQEKRNKLRLVLRDYNKLSDEEKIKCLQKQQAVQAELEAHEPFINNIIKQSREMRTDADEANARLEVILCGWDEVKEYSAQISSDLIQARDMLALHNSFEKTEKWIKEKELMVQVSDTGKDYEHCMALLSKLDDVNSDTTLDDSDLKEMNKLATKLSANDDDKGVYARYEITLERYYQLKEEMMLYRRKLRDAAQVHSFVKDVDDTIERVREKTLILSAREEVEELNCVEIMQRKMEQLELDLTALEAKIKDQELEARKLEHQYELSAGKINDKINQVHKEWNVLEQELKLKKSYIESAYTSLKYIKDVNDFLRILNEVVAEMEFGELPSNSSDAQSLMRSHSDIQPQISMRQTESEMLQEKGHKLLNQTNLFHREIQNSIELLEDINNNLDTAWNNRNRTLLQCRDLQLFLEKTKQIENWLFAKEAFLGNQDIGDSMSSVGALLRKHENFEETCSVNFEKIREIELMACDLKDHSDYELIQSECDELCRRKEALQENCRRRKNMLIESKKLQQLLLDMYEISHWMDEKLRVASDESYRDLTNLLSKTQKHMVFEAEVMANHSRVVEFTKQAEKLIQDNHFASSEIKQYVENVENQWEILMNASNIKKEHLMEASDALQFTRKLEDIHFWLEEAEAQIVFEDYDLSPDSLQQELLKNQELQKESEENTKSLRLLSNIAEEFEQANHFAKEKILSEFKETLQRFHSVENALHTRGSRLEEYLWLAELDKDISDELSWIEENIAVCEIEDNFDDIMTVQALQKKLQALETEILSREPLISSVAERGRRASEEGIEAKVHQLESQFQVLKDTASLKRLRLADALEAQKYYFEANQIEMWIKEKLSQVIGYSNEKNIYSVQAIQKKLHAVDAASAGFRNNIENLEEMCSSLVARNHFDSHNIKIKQEEVTDEYEELRRNIMKKTALLKEKEDYFLYEKDVKNLISQLKSMSNTANSADVGRDLEHVETLLQKFELFGNKLLNYELNVKDLQDKGTRLIEQGHSELESVNEILKEMESSWEKSRDAANNRQKLLEKEKLLHTFYKSVDETESWINEKDVALSSQDYGHDLESIKTLLRHHETLEGDLKAIDEQAQALEDEADNLKTQFSESKDDIETKHQSVQISWMKCKEKSANRKDKLLQAEQLQSYFDEARDFHAWIHEMSALLTSSDLPQDVSACEAVLAQHEGYKSEIDAQMRLFYNFESRGKEIIDSGHFLSQEVENKINSVSQSFKELLESWENRRQIYEQNLDLQLFKKKLIELETWLSSQEHNLNEETGRSVEEVDYLLQKHEQFEKKLELYEIKFEELQEATKVEKTTTQRKEDDEKKRLEEEKQFEKQRLEELRRKEEERLLEERRKELLPTEVKQTEYDEDDDLRFHDLSPDGPSRFTRMSSIRSTMRSIRENPDLARPATPTIIKPEKFPVYIKPEAIPPTTAEGFLMRKQELQSGGKRSTSRQWKNYYTVLCGQLLCFFKDKKNFLDSKASKPPVNILNAKCFIPRDYHKKKYVFRLEVSDRSALLFEAPSDIKRHEWMQKINYTSALPPDKQLISFEEKELLKSKKAFPKLDLNQDTDNHPIYENFGQNQTHESEDDFRLRTLSEDSATTTADEYKFKSSDDESWFNEAVARRKSSEIFDEDLNKSRASTMDQSKFDDHKYANVFDDRNARDSFYDDPFEAPERTYSATSFDPQSARSSVSNTSSYVTAKAASTTSSILTLQDESHDLGSSDDDPWYSNPHTTPRGSTISADSEYHETLSKTQSSTLPSIPTEDMFKKVTKKPKSRRKWFSLRSKNN